MNYGKSPLYDKLSFSRHRKLMPFIHAWHRTVHFFSGRNHAVDLFICSICGSTIFLMEDSEEIAIHFEDAHTIEECMILEEICRGPKV